MRNRKGHVPILRSTQTSAHQLTSAQGDPNVHSPFHRLRRPDTTLSAAALGLAALGFAGTAGASSVDDAFLAQLQTDGIIPPSATVAVKDAHAVCNALDQGHSGREVINAVAQSTGLSPKGAKTFAVDAASAYCPQYVTSS